MKRPQLKKTYIHLTVGYGISDTKVLKVFTSREMAEQLAAAINRGQSTRYRKYNSAAAIRLPISGSYGLLFNQSK